MNNTGQLFLRCADCGMYEPYSEQGSHECDVLAVIDRGGESIVFPRDYWTQLVVSGETDMGYRDWVEVMYEEEEEDTDAG